MQKQLFDLEAKEKLREPFGATNMISKKFHRAEKLKRETFSMFLLLSIMISIVRSPLGCPYLTSLKICRCENIKGALFCNRKNYEKLVSQFRITPKRDPVGFEFSVLNPQCTDFLN